MAKLCYSRIISYLRIVIIITLLVFISCGKTESLKPGIQIQVYADSGVILPNGEKGGAVQAYGIELLKDNTEKVVWKTFLWRFHGLLFDREVDVVYLPDNKVVAFFHHGHKYYEFNLLNGEILKYGGTDLEQFKLMYDKDEKTHISIPERPPYIGDRAQQYPTQQSTGKR
ncbi:MAG: hypothetical protein V1709_03895 [Planctomycetota bacterium]